MLFGKELVTIVAAYALGCIVAGYYLVRVKTGQDVRLTGSGSAGSRNVARTLGRFGFIVTFVGDAAKGAVATWAAVQLDVRSWGVLLVMIAVVAGHVWPAQLGFRGGRGLATALGAILIFDPRILGAVLLVAAVALAATRRATPSGLIAVALAPGVAAVTGRTGLEIVGISVLALLLLATHRRSLRAPEGSADTAVR